jgi:hypothetical protein
MKEASTRTENQAYDSSVPARVVARLRSVAKTAFGDWKAIRDEYVAQRYLVSLLSNYKDG